MTRVELTGLAESDLLDIALHIADDNPERAFSFADELKEACRVADRPLRLPVLPGFESRALRRRVHGHYAIIYAVEDDLVRVLRVLSTAIDLERALGSD